MKSTKSSEGVQLPFKATLTFVLRDETQSSRAFLDLVMATILRSSYSMLSQDYMRLYDPLGIQLSCIELLGPSEV